MIIEYAGEPGLTVYAIVRTETQVYDPSDTGMDSIAADLDHETYALALAEDANVSGYYTGNASVGNTTFFIEYWAQVGDDPDRDADARLGSVKVYWDGEWEWESEAHYQICEAVRELRSLLTGTGGGGGGGTVGDLSDKINLIYRRVNELYSLRQRSNK